jgi:hypothetical protein
MKKITLLFLIILLAAAGAESQSYSTAIGAKFYASNGTYGGFNIRHATSENTALEGSLLFGTARIGFEGLYQYQADIAGVTGLQYFVGGGGLLGFGTSKGAGTAFALRLTGGLDYKFEDAPINISLGLDPFFYLTPATSANLALGIGLRYIIN